MGEPGLSAWIVGAWVALVGACVGSFLNVVIARLPAGDSIVSPGSRCPRCRTPIAWRDNVPVLSWLLLRGRCRSCRARISLRYPAVELAVAVVALLAWQRHGLDGAALAELVAVGILLALALIDMDTWLLPHALTGPLVAVGLGAAVAGWSPAEGLVASAWGAVVGFGVFGLIWLVGEKLLRRELLGLGDAFLLAGIGAWFGLPGLLPVVLLASLQGSVFGIAQLLLGRGQPGRAAMDADGSAEAIPRALEGGARQDATAENPSGADAVGAPPAAESDGWTPPRHAIPFGPFLVAGALEWLYFSRLLAELVPAVRVFV